MTPLERKIIALAAAANRFSGALGERPEATKNSS
jgi:hypothetical protein